MLKVIKDYIPFLVWLLFAGYSLAPSAVRAGEDEVMGSRLREAGTLVEEQRWADLARLQLPARGSAAWSSRPESESRLLFERGLGAARAGYPAMAWHSIERLGTLRDELLTAGDAHSAQQVGERREKLLREVAAARAKTGLARGD